MKINKQARRSAKALFQCCLVDGLLDENRVRRVLEEIIAGRPRGYLPILNHFHRLVKLDIQRRTATVESSSELGAEEKQRIEGRLEAHYGRGLSCSYLTNAALIGGVRIQVGSDVYDGSIAGRLRELQESFQAA